MKSYKLIETYPGSPKLGTIAKQYSKGTKLFHLSDQEGIMDYDEVVNYPKFWEKVTKPFQVLTYRKDDRYDTRRTNGLYGIEYPVKEHQNYGVYPESSYKFFEPHSVRILSTGKVYTVGQQAQPKFGNENLIDALSDLDTNVKTVITKINIDGDELTFTVDVELSSTKTIEIGLDNL